MARLSHPDGSLKSRVILALQDAPDRVVDSADMAKALGVTPAQARGALAQAMIDLNAATPGQVVRPAHGLYRWCSQPKVSDGPEVLRYELVRRLQDGKLLVADVAGALFVVDALGV